MDSSSTVKDVRPDLTPSQIMEVNARRASFVPLVTRITIVRTDITHWAMSQHAVRRELHKFQVLVKDG